MFKFPASLMEELIISEFEKTDENDYYHNSFIFSPFSLSKPDVVSCQYEYQILPLPAQLDYYRFISIGQYVVFVVRCYYRWIYFISGFSRAI